MQMRESTIRETLEMYELYRDGMSTDEVGKRFYVAGATVRMRFNKLGLKPLRRQQAYERVLEMHKMYMDGCTLEEIGEKYDLAYNSVREAFARHNLPKRGQTFIRRDSIHPEQMPECWKLREYGLSYRSIGKRIGKAETTVRKAFKKYGQHRPPDDISGDKTHYEQPQEAARGI